MTTKEDVKALIQTAPDSEAQGEALFNLEAVQEDDPRLRTHFNGPHSAIGYWKGQKTPAAGRDISGIWVRDMLGPPLAAGAAAHPLEQLWSFMESDLLKPLPVNQQLWEEIDRAPTCDEVKRSVQLSLLAQSLSDPVSSHIRTPFDDGITENMNLTRYQSVVGDMLALLDRLGGSQLGFTANRNTADASATVKSKRPDYLLWVNDFLLFKAEEKDTKAKLRVAIAELVDKMRGWPMTDLGHLPYFLCYAAAGCILQFFVLSKDDDVFPGMPRPGIRPISKEFNLAEMDGRIAALAAVVNVYRLLRQLTPYTQQNVQKVFGTLDRPWNQCSVDIFFDCVRKRVRPLALSTMRSSWPLLSEVYPATAGVEGLVHALKGPKHNEEEDIYSVTLQPRGTNLIPDDTPTLKLALKGVLNGLAGLHAAGYVHRDVRWSNVLCSAQGWFLSDLENVARKGEDPSRAADRFRSVAWTEETLDSSGCYTSQSDVQLVGLLMEDLSVTHLVTGNLIVLRQKLLKRMCSQRPEAAAALKYLVEEVG